MEVSFWEISGLIILALILLVVFGVAFWLLFKQMKNRKGRNRQA